MVFVKKNAALMFVIILLKLDVSFCSSLGGSSNDVPSSSRPNIQNKSSKLSKAETIAINKYIQTGIIECLRQIETLFPDSHSQRKYINHAICHLNQNDFHFEYYLDAYYKSFHQWVTIELETVTEFCHNQFPASGEQNQYYHYVGSCIASINSFLLFDYSTKPPTPFNGDYYNTICHTPLSELVIDPQIIVYNILYYLDFRKASNARGYPEEYFELLSKGCSFKRKTKFKDQSFKKPNEFCVWLVEKNMKEQPNLNVQPKENIQHEIHHQPEKQYQFGINDQSGVNYQSEENVQHEVHHQPEIYYQFGINDQSRAQNQSEENVQHEVHHQPEIYYQFGINDQPRAQNQSELNHEPDTNDEPEVKDESQSSLNLDLSL